ncbi:hypothetical protein Taro_030895 [Colocasia esculenta]|uniref:Uncharacterized protein n=1 Tax=Colocasia esculenta TaxID=4460 RepID=A0A843W4Q5_COLES|nr:hypothetical protein [Colocasia esculenta]
MITKEQTYEKKRTYGVVVMDSGPFLTGTGFYIKREALYDATPGCRAAQSKTFLQIEVLPITHRNLLQFGVTL